MPFSAKMLPSHRSNHSIGKNEMIIGKMKYFIGKMVWINEIEIIRIGKMFQYIKLNIYILTRKMKFNANNEKFS
jgi:hypothetical protein